MDASEAYDILVGENKNDMVCTACYDLGRYFLFMIMPSNAAGSTYQSGTIYPVVEKDTGRIGTLSLYDLEKPLDEYEVVSIQTK